VPPFAVIAAIFNEAAVVEQGVYSLCFFRTPLSLATTVLAADGFLSFCE